MFGYSRHPIKHHRFLTQQNCRHMETTLAFQAGRVLLVCKDCGDVLVTDMPVYVKD